MVTKKFMLSRVGEMSDSFTLAEKINFQKFSDGEIKVEIPSSIRECRVVIVGSLTNSDDIMEFIMAGDAAKRAAAKEVFAIVPYLPYMRQDRKDTDRTAIGARVIANMIEAAGFDQLMTLDLHSTQIEGFFNIPVTHIYGRSIFCPYIKSRYQDLSDMVIASPDVGGAKRAKKFASCLDIPIVIIDKERKVANEVASMELIGDVTGKRVMIVDDMVDTAGSLCTATDLLLERGAKEVISCITHGVLSGPAIERIRNSNLTKLYITDSIPFNGEPLDKIEIVPCGDMFNKCLGAIQTGKSISELQS